jgi:hypothetical protein
MATSAHIAELGRRLDWYAGRHRGVPLSMIGIVASIAVTGLRCYANGRLAGVEGHVDAAVA